MKNNKGITLISLISSIILLLILSATTVATSMNAYNQMKFEGAKAELEEVQKLIDQIVADYQTYEREVSSEDNKTYAKYFADRYNDNEEESVFSGKLLSAHQTEAKAIIDKYTDLQNDINSEDAFYFSSDDLVKYFNLKGIEPVVVVFSKRRVYSVEGIKDSNDKSIVYYTPSEWGASTAIEYNGNEFQATASIVEVSGLNVTIDVTPKLNTNILEVYSCKDNKYRKITDYRIIENPSNTIIKVIVDSHGTYKFKIVDELKNSYETSEKNL